jgi:hypothetical protein
MIPVLLMNPDNVRRAPNRPGDACKPEDECSATLQAEEPPKVAAEFQPLDPSVVSEAIPAFYIGRNEEGFWVARDVKGRTGGIFLFEDSAVSFARRNSRPTGCATIFSSERLELDLKNGGNPLIGHLGHLKRFAIRHQQRMIAFIDTMMKAIRCRLKDFPVP